MSFHDAVVYQIYPKSFRDSDGDGVGDLRGIIDKVPYIASLGVDYVWFNPFYPSPGHDNGYDISDYCAIDPAMGTMEDFEDLVAALGKRGIGVMLDMVLNHVSTDHEWFQRALAGDPEYQDYFYLLPPKEDGSLPTNWVSKFGGPAWAPFGDARSRGGAATRPTSTSSLRCRRTCSTSPSAQCPPAGWWPTPPARRIVPRPPTSWPACVTGSSCSMPRPSSQKYPGLPRPPIPASSSCGPTGTAPMPCSWRSCASDERCQGPDGPTV